MAHENRFLNRESRELIFDAIGRTARSALLLSAILALTLFSGPSPAQAKSLRSLSLDELSTLALQGDPAAQTDLGERYEFGRGGAERDLQQARSWYEKAAEQNHADGLRALGVLYEEGKGMAKDPALAASYYLKAADLGLARAQVNLGILYEQGLGVEKNYEQALHWYTKAADQGYPRGLTYLGNLYEQGLGTEQDFHRARTLYLAAANGRYTRGQTRLGMLYEKGLGVEVDLDQARSWYEKAAAQGYPPAQEALARLKEQKTVQPAAKEDVPEKKAAPAAPTPAPVKDEKPVTAVEVPEKVTPQPAEPESVPAQEESGQVLPGPAAAGKEPPPEKPPEKAADAPVDAVKDKPAITEPPEPEPETLAWYQWAAERGDGNAQNTLGLMYLQGEEGLDQDPAMAARWFKRAADSGNNAAQNNLGLLYTQGNGVEKDFKQAAHWFQQSAGSGNVAAQNNLGLMYTEGQGVEADPEKAAFWLEKAAEGGHAVAQNNIGVMLANGQGVEKNLTMAAYWLEKSVAQGNDKARANLQIIKKALSDEQASRAAAIEKSEPPAQPSREESPAETTGGETTGTGDGTVRSAVEHFHFGNLYAKDEKYDKAISEYTKAAALDPQNANTYENLAVVYAKINRMDEAIKTMRIAIQLRPTDADKYATLGIIYHANNESAKAIAQYVYAARLNPGLDWLFYNMAVIHVELKQYARAWQSARIAQALGYKDQAIFSELKKIAPDEDTWRIEQAEIHLRQIIVARESDAHEIRSILQKNRNFPELADQASLAPKPVNGGYIGPMATAPAQLAESITHLPLLEISPVVAREDGYHIFQKIPVAADLLQLQ